MMRGGMKRQRAQEIKDWRIDKDAQAHRLRQWLDHQIAMRNRLIDESEFDSGIQAPFDVRMNIMGDIVKAMRVNGIENIARILNCETSTVTNDELGGTIAAVMYEDYMLYDKVK